MAKPHTIGAPFAASVTDHSAMFTALVATGPDDTPYHYRYVYGTPSDPAFRGIVPVPDSNVPKIPIGAVYPAVGVATDLKPSTEYWLNLFIDNADGEAEFTGLSFTTSNDPTLAIAALIRDAGTEGPWKSSGTILGVPPDAKIVDTTVIQLAGGAVTDGTLSHIGWNQADVWISQANHAFDGQALTGQWTYQPKLATGAVDNEFQLQLHWTH